MLKKEDLLDKISGMILVSEDNRKRLVEIVEKLDREEDLKAIDELVNQDDVILQKTIDNIIELELQAGDSGILEVIDKTLSDAKKGFREASHIQEKDESQEDIKKAEDLLQQF